MLNSAIHNSKSNTAVLLVISQNLTNTQFCMDDLLSRFSTFDDGQKREQIIGLPSQMSCPHSIFWFLFFATRLFYTLWVCNLKSDVVSGIFWNCTSPFRFCQNVHHNPMLVCTFLQVIIKVFKILSLLEIGFLQVFASNSYGLCSIISCPFYQIVPEDSVQNSGKPMWKPTWWGFRGL